MQLIHLSQKDYRISRWSGGTTTQLAIAPPEADYARRDFLWRVSSATVELEESDFTALPDYHRWISPLRGSMALSHNGGAELTLTPYQIHAFDGGAATHSRGCCTDFNLMLRKGQTRGSLRALHLSGSEESAVSFSAPHAPELPRSALLLFCAEGSFTASLGDEHLRAAAFESVLLPQAEGKTLLLRGEAVLLIAQLQSQ